MTSEETILVLEEYTRRIRDHGSIESKEVREFFEENYQRTPLLFITMRVINSLYEKRPI
jgi:hypothetical protein